jgi:hypothetical protein
MKRSTFRRHGEARHGFQATAPRWDIRHRNRGNGAGADRARQREHAAQVKRDQLYASLDGH